MITTKRHKFRFFFSIGFASVIFLGLGFMVFFSFYHLLTNGDLQAKNYMLLVLGFGCFIMAFYTVYQFYMNSPIVEIDSTTIKLKGIKTVESYSLSDIEEIQLTGKIPFRYIVRYPVEGITIKIRNGETLYIYDDMYSNTWQLKSFIDDVVISKKVPRSYSNTKLDDSLIDYESMDLYKGNQFTSFRGITLWGFVVFLLFLQFSQFYKGDYASIGLYIFFTCIGFCWFLFNSYLMHYFGIDKNFFVVRNHNLFWLKDIYHISEIKEVVFETQGKMPNCLRVITKRYRSSLYPAGTLRTKDWLTLQSVLEKRGVDVRNECIY